MKTRHEYEAKLEKWLEKWDEKFQSAASAEEHPLQEKLDDMKVVHLDIREKLQEMKQSDDDKEWMDMKERVDNLVGHIDESFRESLAYFH